MQWSAHRVGGPQHATRQTLITFPLQIGKIHPLAADDTYIVSDLHLGSEYFGRENFLRFLDGLPDGAGLVLNGDTIDEPGDPLPAEHERVLERLVDESRRRRVVWVYGNHDETFALPDPGGVEFVRRFEVDGRLLVVHGDQLDSVMPRHGLFKAWFKRLHRLRLRLGFQDVHVASYAKRWGLLYRVLSNHVARRALAAAERGGFEAVTCGHTHAPMEIERQGRRYLNTGAWTEEPHYYVVVAGGRIDLKVYPNGLLP